MHPFRKHGSFCPFLVIGSWNVKHAFVKLFFLFYHKILPFFTLLTFPSCVVLVRERTTQIIGIACKDDGWTPIVEPQLWGRLAWVQNVIKNLTNFWLIFLAAKISSFKDPHIKTLKKKKQCFPWKNRPPKTIWWFSNRFFPCFFSQKNHGYIPNQSFEFSENRWASERIPELKTDGYLYLILQEPSSPNRFQPCTLEGYGSRIRLQILKWALCPHWRVMDLC